MDDMLTMPRLGRSERLRIAFYGPMAVGKTWCANYLVDNGHFAKASFADKLKSLAYDLYGITGKDGRNREVLQNLGDSIRLWDKDVFIKHALYRIQEIELTNKYINIVLDDLRFINEAKILQKNGFMLVRVDCNEETRQERIAALYKDFDYLRLLHKSELEWRSINPDLVIDSTNETVVLDLEMLLSGADKDSLGR